MDTLNIIYSIVILIFSVVIHEVAHGYAALFLGDPTAKYEKRLTLNPLRHIDPVGSILVPIITSFAGLTFGWAKPVPYNPYNLKNPRWGEFFIALAGPVSNLVIALLAAVSLNYVVGFIGLTGPAISLLLMIVVVNISLMVFNLTPLYPLDGSKVLFAFIPAKYEHVKEFLIRYSFPLLLLALLFLGSYWSAIIETIVKIILTGL